MSNKFSKKNLKFWTKWNRKMGCRSCFITSGAFGHGLLYSVQYILFSVTPGVRMATLEAACSAWTLRAISAVIPLNRSTAVAGDGK